MGIEYSIRFARPSDAVLDGAIRGLPFFCGFDERYQIYSLRLDRDHARPGMPDAHVRIEPGGIYFCDNCGAVGRIRDALMAVARRFDPAVTIEEL